MGGRKVRDRMKLKKYIVLELRKREETLKNVPREYLNYSYLEGWIDALKWVLNKD